jgi:hypothetical protein
MAELDLGVHAMHTLHCDCASYATRVGSLIKDDFNLGFKKPIKHSVNIIDLSEYWSPIFTKREDVHTHAMYFCLWPIIYFFYFILRDGFVNIICYNMIAL